MKQNEKEIFELGKFKSKIHAALYKSDDIKELLLGDVSGKSTTEMRKLFKEHVKSHLFVDEVITETNSFIFYDVTLPSFEETTKMCQIQLYAVCHRDILDNYSKEGFYGNRADILTEMIERALICDEETSESFGIGHLELNHIGVYNGRNVYGHVLQFSVPNFR
jgi:hypothetical protein